MTDMDADDRSFQPIHVTPIGVEDSTSRFTQGQLNSRPPVARWRNNLTALSRKYNLYFQAAEEYIDVYEPDFPYQDLGGTPRLRIPPALAKTDAPGYLSDGSRRVSPHCIDHLIVGDLGTREILLVCTDSGNVAAYYTSAVFDAVQRDFDDVGFDARADLGGLRAFFTHWVYRSAWGLAIHSEGRMLAVSANVPNSAQVSEISPFATITVFAFALTTDDHGPSANDDDDDKTDDDDDDHQSSHVEWHRWSPRKGKDNVPDRSRNYKIVLGSFGDGHQINVPNISFVNAATDHEGSWLVSTDIDGELRLWQIWNGESRKVWHYGARDGPGAEWVNERFCGWNVAAIDLQSFRPVRTMEEFIGGRKAPMYRGYNERGDSYDITRIVENQTPCNSDHHPLTAYRVNEIDALPDNRALNELSDPEDVEMHDDEREGEAADLLELDNSDGSEAESPVGSGQPLVQATPFSQLTTGGLSPTSSEMMRVEDDVESSDEEEIDSDDEPTEDGQHETVNDMSTLRPTYQRSLSASRHEVRERDFVLSRLNSSKPEPGRPALPLTAILHCSTSHVRLLRSPEARSPHVFCARMLAQVLPPHIYTHRVYQNYAAVDRLNMIQQIPELGVVLIATQVGRVAVCSLTRRPDGLPGFRVDWTLPTKRQERNGARPVVAPLLGIAAGPVQGYMDSEDDDDEFCSGEESEEREDEHVGEGDESRRHSSYRSSDDDDDDDDADRSSISERDIPAPLENEDVSQTRTRIQMRIRTRSNPCENHSHYHSRSGRRDRSGRSKRSHRTNHHASARIITTAAAAAAAAAAGGGRWSWTGVEHSRRFRVMLTYADRTVLTYELARQPENHEVGK